MSAGIGLLVVLILVVGVFQNRNFQRRIVEILRGQADARTVIDDTHTQVVTMNESTAGQLLADGETRRIEGIPHDERTAKEQRHVDDAPEPDPPQGPEVDC